MPLCSYSYATSVTRFGIIRAMNRIVRGFPRKNVSRLAVAQALAGANSVVAYATGAVVGDTLAPRGSLATLPISVFVVGMAISTLPTGYIAKQYGRRAAFMVGTGCGVLIGLFSAAAVMFGSFFLLCVGMLFGGAYAAVTLSFRFTAADCVEPPQRARALSIVMMGGIAAGVLGPQLVTHTMDIWPNHRFVATYLCQSGVAIISALVLWGVEVPPPATANNGAKRPLSTIVREPKFLGAVLCGTMSYLLMNLLMTSAPLAMKMHGLTMSDSNLGIQWHVIAMYAPSLITGRLITRFGAPRIAMTGLLITAMAATEGLLGTDVGHFWITLILLGVGWNLGFLAASAMILEHQLPTEKTRIQSLNDFLVFGTIVLGSFSSGGLLSAYGWTAVCAVAYPPLLIAAIGLLATQIGVRRQLRRV
jgi:MFS family permease